MKTTLQRGSPVLSLSDVPWAVDLIGKPWVSGGRGPESFDCWGLLRWVYWTQLGIELPTFPEVDAKDFRKVAALVETETGGDQWLPLKTPELLSAVVISRGRVSRHVGVWLPIERGLVLHAAEHSNVVAQSLVSLRGLGFNSISHFRHVSHRSNHP